MGEQIEITPYRMGTLMTLADKVTKQMLSNACHLTYDEMEIVLNLIRYGINESRDMNKRQEESMKGGIENGDYRAAEGRGEDCS